MKKLALGGIAALMMSAALAAGPAAAVPASSSMVLKNAGDMSTEVAYRGRRHGYRHGYRRGGRWIGPAIGLGIAAGAAIAHDRYYDDGYYGNRNSGYAPRRGCYTDEGQGRYRPCDAGGGF
jgi:hypothetical protein